VNKPELEERLDVFALLEANTSTIAVAHDDSTFLVDTSDRGVGFSLFRKGNRPEFGVLTQAVAVLGDLHPRTKSERGTFVDIGANIGTSVVPALRTHGFSRGVACEPAPANYRLLRANLVLNGIADRARALPVAVTDRVGLVELKVHATNSGGHKIVPPFANSDAPAITVDGVTLDLLVERGFFEPEESTLVLMDAQGHEGHVLRGGSAVCRSGVPWCWSSRRPSSRRSTASKRCSRRSRSTTPTLSTCADPRTGPRSTRRRTSPRWPPRSRRGRRIPTASSPGSRRLTSEAGKKRLAADDD
jgi:FkbM family methyltransferase